MKRQITTTSTRRILLLSCAMLLALTSLLAPSALMQQQGGPYQLRPSVVAGGGGASSNATTKVQGTIGQAVLGLSSGGSFSLNAGFWQGGASCVAATIASQPSPQTVCAGTAASFSVTASGMVSTYQWRKNGVNLTNGGSISGATSATLTINPTVAGDAASYDVVISSACSGAPVTSDAVALTINGYALAPAGQSFPASGGNGSLTVTAAATCSWTAQTVDSWIMITSGLSGSGNGTVSYSVANNSGAARSGTITIADQTFTITQNSPTQITLISFQATAFDTGVFFEWQTGFEVDNLGFRLYCEEGGKRTLINSQLIAGSALVAGSRTPLLSGEGYTWWSDSNSGGAAGKGAAYWLEDLDLNGASTWHGPFFAKPAAGKPAAQSRAASLNGLGKTSSRTHPLEPAARLVQVNQPGGAPSAQQVALASSRAIKVGVKRAGWYRLTQSELINAGLDAGVDPRHLQLFVDGKEVPCLVIGEADGKFDAADAVEFYGLGLDTPVTDTRIYWLSVGKQAGKRIVKALAAKGTAGGDSFPYSVERRDRSIYFSALRNGEAENFFGAVVSATPIDQALTITNLAPSASGEATVEVSLQGVTTVSHQVSVRLNGSVLGYLSFNGQAGTTEKFPVPLSMLTSGENLLTLQTLNGSGDLALVHFLRLTYPHTLSPEQDTLPFTASSGEQLTLHGFTTKSVRLFDVTESDGVQELMTDLEEEKDAGGYRATFTVGGGGERRLLALTNDQALHAASIKADAPSTWRAPNHRADLLIISEASLMASLSPLVDLRSKQGFGVAVIDVEDLYDEFSFGNKAPQSIKDFLGYASKNWQGKPRFVLFAGDASYDPRNYLGLGERDLVPTKLIDTVFLETASDDWFADFTGDGLAALNIGRLPVRSPQEASAMIAKLVAYEQAPISNEVLLAADRNEGFNFEQASANLRLLIPATLRIEEVFRSRSDDATARNLLLQAINRGQKVVNYAGHGSVNQWHGNLLSDADAQGLTNTNRLSLFVMMACLNGYFIDAMNDSLAEALLRAEGGAVAAWASSALCYPEQQERMNAELYRLLFNGSGHPQTLGEMVRQAKGAITDPDIRRSWILLGDPTMRIR